MTDARRCLIVIRLHRASLPRPQLRVGAKFFLAVGVMLLAVLTVTLAAEVSLTRTKQESDQLFNNHLLTIQRTAALTNALDDVARAALLRTQAQLPVRRVALDTELDAVLV